LIVVLAGLALVTVTLLLLMLTGEANGVSIQSPPRTSGEITPETGGRRPPVIPIRGQDAKGADAPGRMETTGGR